jgi:hypothetical protein
MGATFMRYSVVLLVLATLWARPFAQAQQPPAAAPATATSIEPPRDEKLLLLLQGDGVQIYGCSVDNGAAVWKFQGPEAKLTTEKGSPAGTHFAGPTWKLLDGSQVKASMVATKPATESGAVAWLLLKVVDKSGDGELRTAEYITRTNTKGGAAPSTGCDAAHQGQQARVPYTATYRFYGK